MNSEFKCRQSNSLNHWLPKCVFVCCKFKTASYEDEDDLSSYVNAILITEVT